jgi:hypothetical protein
LGRKRKLTISTTAMGGGPASDSLDLVKKHRSIEGFGTDAGLYAHPFPNVQIGHIKEAVAEHPSSANPKITVACAHNEIIRSVHTALFTVLIYNATVAAQSSCASRFQLYIPS